MNPEKQPSQKRIGTGLCRLPVSRLFRSVCRAAAVLLVICPAAMRAAENTASKSQTKSPVEMEYEKKAMYLFNFMRFIEWPEVKATADRQYEKETILPAEKEEQPPFIIGIWGQNPFGQAFEPVLDKKINDRAILLVQLESFESYRNAAESEGDALAAYNQKYAVLLNQCDVLFVCASETDCLKQLLPLTAHSTAVTISDIPDFVLHGGMIGFVTESKKIRFDINLDTVKKQKIKIRSQLLELARKIIKSQTNKPGHDTLSLQ